MAKIVPKQLPGHRELIYYYQHSYRVKIHPGSEGKGPGSGPSQVKTESIYLGTADQVRDRCRAGLAPQKVQAKAFGWVMTVLHMIDSLGLVDAVNQYVPQRQQGLSPGVYIGLGVLAPNYVHPTRVGGVLARGCRKPSCQSIGSYRPISWTRKIFGIIGIYSV